MRKVNGEIRFMHERERFFLRVEGYRILCEGVSVLLVKLKERQSGSYYWKGYEEFSGMQITPMGFSTRQAAAEAAAKAVAELTPERVREIISSEDEIKRNYNEKLEQLVRV